MARITKAKELSEALYEVLHDVCIVQSLTQVSVRSLDKQDLACDERITLEVALKMLKSIDTRLNRLADDNSPVVPLMPGIGEATDERGGGE